MPLQLAPFRSNGRKPRTLYPFLVVPLLALVLIAGTLAFYLNNAAKAAQANALTTFPGTVPALVGQSKLIGPANANQSISLSFGLRPRDADVLKSYADSITKPKSANYHHFLTPGQAQSVFAPSKQVHDAILQYLRSSGFSITHTYKHRMTITFTGTIGQVESVFHVTINNYTASNGKTFYANAEDPQVPAWMAGQLQSIGGLNNIAHWSHGPVASRPLSSRKANPNSVSCPGHGAGYYTPDQTAASYNLNGLYNKGLHGEGQTVALFELDTYQPGDISAYTSCFGHTHTSIQTSVIHGRQAVPTDSGVLEVELDAELVLSAVPQLGTLVIYEAGNDVVDYNAEWAQIIQDAPAVVSSSWGLCESDYGQQEVQLENNYFNMAAIQGQSIFVASGDTGSSGCYGEVNSPKQKALEPGDPGEQPYVTGVGGTTLNWNGSSASESVWNNSTGASGGGLSLDFPRPAWQSNVPGLQNQYSNGQREAPDVSLSADPNEGYLIYCTSAAAGCTGGSWWIVGGTSAAAPLWAALMALVNEESMKSAGFNIGFASPLLYQLASNPTSYAKDFHDITLGNNDYAGLQGGKYPATSGYDMATGLGSYNGDALATDLVALAKANKGQRSSPANTTWYFPEGNVGGGFHQFYTVENPSAQTANITIDYLFGDHTRAISHTVSPLSRQTIDANNDLGVSVTGPHNSFGAIVTSAIPVVVERPAYFNWGGISSGNDGAGATTTSQSYYFSEADTRQAGAAHYQTFVSLLNPGNTSANVKLTYYTNACGGSGQPACQVESVTVPSMRRLSVSPSDKGLHQKVAIAVSADHSIVAERVLYFSDYIPRAGGTTTGSATVIGATAPHNDWLFAEGYTGPGFQEDFELANFGTIVANVNIKLEFTNGSTQTFPVTVAPAGFTEFDVNAHGISSDVSAEITSDQNIVAQRLMYFHFGGAHISGGTDIVGEVGPASHNVYAFAEGFTGGQFSEFLTLQNPTNNNETVAITFFTPTVVFQVQSTVLAHSRKTFSINSMLNPIYVGSVSLTVQALGSGSVIVAERPMYFIYSGTQGGTDVLGYTGQ